MTLVAQSKETIDKSRKGGKRPRNDVNQIVCRTMMVDEILFRAIRNNKFHAPKQVVILGSGYPLAEG